MSSFEGAPEIVGSNTARANAAKGRANEMDWVVHAETGPDTVSSEEAKAQADRDGKISQAESEAVGAEMARLEAEVAEAEAEYRAVAAPLVAEHTRRKVLKSMIADPMSTPEEIAKFTGELGTLPNDEQMNEKMQPVALAKKNWDAKKSALETAQKQAKFVADAKAA